MSQQSYHVIIIGAGASGLLCALEAAKNGKKVLLIDHQVRPGQKIMVSGGGKCNFTNLNLDSTNYISQNPAFCLSALKRFSQFDCIRFFESLGLTYEERKLGQLFCTVPAKKIVEKLVSECKRHGVEMYFSCHIEQLLKKDVFSIQTDKGLLKSVKIVIATGGLSYKNLGASDFGYKIAKQFGLNIIATFPGLVPLTFDSSQTKFFEMLSGISIPAVLTVGEKSFRDDLLFTHTGFSGPVALQISSYINSRTITMNILPDIELFESFKKSRLNNPRTQLSTILTGLLPKRFVKLVCDNQFENKCMQEYSDNLFRQISKQLQSWELRPTGNRGYDIAEITVGGVDTRELSSKTFESKKIAGLYFIGEVLDVTGQLGGYNLQWAWSSGCCCGQDV